MFKRRRITVFIEERAPLGAGSRRTSMAWDRRPSLEHEKISSDPGRRTFETFPVFEERGWTVNRFRALGAAEGRGPCEIKKAVSRWEHASNG